MSMAGDRPAKAPEGMACRENLKTRGVEHAKFLNSLQ